MKDSRVGAFGAMALVLALLAWPLVQSATLLLNEMASFESASVSGRAD
jgi:cobalamin synthase